MSNFHENSQTSLKPALIWLLYKNATVAEVTDRNQMKMVEKMAQNAQLLSVRGPDGRPLTLADLPKPGITRWVTRRKAEIVAAVGGGLLTEEEALRRYDLSEEEFSGWRALYSKHGRKGLRTTRLQQYR